MEIALPFFAARARICREERLEKKLGPPKTNPNGSITKTMAARPASRPRSGPRSSIWLASMTPPPFPQVAASDTGHRPPSAPAVIHDTRCERESFEAALPPRFEREEHRPQSSRDPARCPRRLLQGGLSRCRTGGGRVASRGVQEDGVLPIRLEDGPARGARQRVGDFRRPASPRAEHHRALWLEC